MARLFYIDIKGFAQRNRHILWSRCAGDSSAYLQQKAEKWFIKLSSDVYDDEQETYLEYLDLYLFITKTSHDKVSN